MSTPRSLLRGTLVAAIAAALGLGLYVHRHTINADVEAPYHRDLRHLEALGAELDRELLRSRAGLVMHYDGLTRAFQELRQTTERVALPPPELGFDPGPALRAALERLAALLHADEQLLDRFKSDNAVLRNSRQYYPVLLEELLGKLPRATLADPLRERLGEVLAALAHFEAAPAGDAVALLAAALDRLERVGASSPITPTEVALVIRHGRLITVHHAGVDRVVANILDLPIASEIAAACASYEASLAGAARRAQIEIALLSVLIAAAVMLGLLEMIARARADARALREAKAELESANRALDHERQREQDLNALKTRFVSATSHEFRTPLTTILSSSQMLATYGERWDAARRMTHFERISSAAHHMTEMLEEILLIGRAEMGVLAPSPVALDLHEFCQGLIETLSRAAGRQTTIELDFTGERRVELDRRLLTHVLGNLLENALKYSEPPAAVSLRVAVEKGGVRALVSDAGVGIPASDLPRLFDSFYRGQNVGAVPGSGLGLAVVKRALDVQAGTIDISSEPGRGTRVSVWLPIDPRTPISEAERAEPDPPDPAANQPLPALLTPPSRVRSAVKDA